MEMAELMKQAAELQSKVAAAQDMLGTLVVKGVAGNGECIVEMTGKYDLVKLTIAPNLFERGIDMATAVIAEAFRDAKAKADVAIDKIMIDATAGMPLPK